MAERAARWPLHGRVDELRFIDDALSRPDGRGVVLVGEAGVGKTRLAEEALALARRHGWATAWVGAAAVTAGIPLGAFAPLLPPSLVEASTDRFALLALAVQALVERAGVGRLLLAIDDAHDLDPLSATVVRQAVVPGTGDPIAVVVTLRRGTAPPEPVTSLWKEGIVERLEVARLSRPETDELVAAALGGPVESMTLQHLWEAAEGNVLFLREIVLDARASGDLAPQDGIWRLGRRPRLGARLADLVDVRLGRLTEEEEQVVALVAFGEPLEVDIVGEIAPGDALASLEARGLVHVTGEGVGSRLRARLAHPLYAEAVRARTPVLRARAVYGRLAERLHERGVGAGQDVLRLALWRLESGTACSPSRLLDACQHARRLFDFGLAERLALAAVEQGGGVEAQRMVGECLYSQGRFEAAETRLAPLAGNDRDRARATVSRAVNLMWGLDRSAEAESLLRRAELAITDRRLADEIAALRAQLVLAAGRLDEAIGTASELLARPATQPAPVLSAVTSAAAALALSGRTGEAIALLDEHREAMLTHAEELPNVFGLYLDGRSIAAWLAGDLSTAAASAEDLHGLGLAYHAQEAACSGARNRGWAELARGRVRRAIGWYRQALATVPEGDVNGLSCWCHALLAEALAVADDPAAAGALEQADSARRPAIRAFDGQIEMARAWVTARERGLAAAIEVAERGARDASAQGAHTVEVHLLYAVVRFGEADRVHGRLRELVTRVDGGWVPRFVAHAAALAAEDPTQLAEVSSSFEEMGAALLAAEAAAQEARLLRARGLSSRARVAAARGASLASECDGVRTPALAEVHAPVPLTRREREVAQLAARGLSSPDIARRLSVSVRTVEGHLYRLYAKLGVSRREELASRLGG